MMSDYGFLGYLIGIAGNLAAAALALQALWAGRTGWEPNVRDFPNAPTRVTALASMIGIAITFATTRSLSNIAPIVSWTVIFLFVGIVAFLCDIVARTTLIVKCPEEKDGIIGGLWLTQTAKEILSGDAKAYKAKHLSKAQQPPGSVQDLFCNSGRVPGRIWPPLAQALGHALIVAAFMCWTACATIGLACASILIEKALAR